jgi:hypothetical protein
MIPFFAAPVLLPALCLGPQEPMYHSCTLDIADRFEGQVNGRFNDLPRI